MQKERIRVLVDRSRDAGWSDALTDIEPDDVYQVTDNKDYLKWSVLKNYDVLTMCGYPTLPYKDEEIQIIKKFVELGGGLLLASSTGRFERDVGKSIPEMQLNRIANIFGAEFLPLDACKAEIKIDSNHVRGYIKESLYLADRPVFADLYLDDIPFSNCGIISIPDGADVMILHSETLEPVSACINFGKGRILIINEVTFSQRSQRTCNAFLDWLGRNRFSKISGDEWIPDEIPVDEYVKEDGNIEIFYNSFVTEDRVDTCLKFAKKISEYMNSTFPDNTNRKWKIELTPSCTYERASMWKEPVKGAFMSDHRLAYAVGVEYLMRSEFLRNLTRNVLDPQALSEYCGIVAMRLLGFENEADRTYLEIVKQFKEKNPTGTEIDIEYNGSDLKVYVTVKGQQVAHVFSMVDCGISHFPYNTHVTGAYVNWVSTNQKYRRLGLSSLAMQETLAHPSMRRCSYAVLTTGIENPAHAMYRSFGFVDLSFMETFNLDLHKEEVNVPDELVLRSYSHGDEIKMAELTNECYSDSMDMRRVRAVRVERKDDVIKIAERNGEMLGYVIASVRADGNETELGGVCLRKTDEGHKIGSILLRSLHNDLLSRGYNRVTFWCDSGNKESLRELLNSLGYYSRLIGGVKMFKLINLPMLLEEITPLLMKRLTNSDHKDWQGKIGISGIQHKATIIIENEISIAEEILKDINIHLQANDDTITRIVIGRLTPYDAYLQRELTIKPIVNDKVANLLKTLFPKIPG